MLRQTGWIATAMHSKLLDPRHSSLLLPRYCVVRWSLTWDYETPTWKRAVGTCVLCMACSAKPMILLMTARPARHGMTATYFLTCSTRMDLPGLLRVIGRPACSNTRPILPVQILNYCLSRYLLRPVKVVKAVRKAHRINTTRHSGQTIPRVFHPPRTLAAQVSFSMDHRSIPQTAFRLDGPRNWKSAH